MNLLLASLVLDRQLEESRRQGDRTEATSSPSRGELSQVISQNALSFLFHSYVVGIKK
jgi:hypothetical protein